MAIVAGLAGPRAAAGVVAGIGLAGGLAFAATQVFGESSRRGSGGRLGLRHGTALAPWLLLGSSLVMAFSMDEVAVVAFVTAGRTGGTLASGLVLAVWSAGSMLGGVIVGSRQRVATDRSTLLGCLAIGLALAVVVVAPGRIGLAILLFATGWLIAPGLSQIYQRIAAAAPDGAQTEAFGWLAVAFIIGAAVGASVGGACVTALGARAGLGLAALPPVVSTGLALLLLRRWTPEAIPVSAGPADSSERPVVSAP